MLLRWARPVERHCSRAWSWAVGALLLCVAVGLSGAGLRADTNPPDDGEDVIVGLEVREVVADPELEAELRKLITRLLQNLKDEDLEKEIKDLVERLRRRHEQGNKGDAKIEGKVKSRQTAKVVDLALALPASGGDGRLGIQVQPPSAALIEHLDLPRDRGMVVVDVRKDSPADKAGIKTNDILLEINGQDVPSDHGKLSKLIASIKSDKEIQVVVMRRGKKETIKTVQLPEAGKTMRLLIDPKVENWVPRQELKFAPVSRKLDKGYHASVFRSGDRATARHEEGSLIITVTARIDSGKARLTEVHVQDGKDTDVYENLDKVPARYRDKVANLIQLCEKE